MTDIANLSIGADSRQVTKAADDLDRLTASAAKAEAAVARLGSSSTPTERLAAGLTKVAAAANQNDVALGNVQRSTAGTTAALEASAVAHARAEAAAGKFGKTANDAAKSSRQVAYEIANTRAQLIDIGVQLQGGQNPFTIMVQQLPQIVQGFGPGTGLRGILAGVGESVVGLVRPLGLVGGGLAAVAAAAATAGGAYLGFDNAQKDIAIGLNGLGRQSGLARDQIEALARTSDLATSDARKLATAFAATGNATKDSVAGALTQTRNFAVTFSTDIEGAGKVQEEFFANASTAYDKYAGRLGVFSAATSRQIKDLQQTGRNADATKVAFDDINRGLTTYAENAGIARSVTDRLSETFSNLYTGLGRATAVLGGDSRALGNAAAIAAAERAGEIARAQSDAERVNVVVTERARANRDLRLNPVERDVKASQVQAGVANAKPTLEERLSGAFSVASQASTGSFGQYPTTYGEAEERMRKSMTPTPEEGRAQIRRVTETTNEITQQKALTETLTQATRAERARSDALGKSAGEADRVTIKAQLYNRANAEGAPVSAETARRIDEVSASLGRQAQAYAQRNLEREIGFQRSQLDRTPTEQYVAASLRPVYGDDMSSKPAQAAAEQLRLNDSIRQTQAAYSSLAQMGSTLIDPMIDSTRTWSDAFSGLTRNIARALLQASLFGQGPFAGAFGTQGAGAGPGGLFGSALGAAGLLGGASSNPVQGPTQSGATLDTVAGGGGLLGTAVLGLKSLFGFADGGRVTGAGGPREDRVLARLSPGEFVVNAAATNRNLGLLQAINSGRMQALADGGLVSAAQAALGLALPGFADGGLVRGLTPTPEIGEEVSFDVRIAA